MRLRTLLILLIADQNLIEGLGRFLVRVAGVGNVILVVGPHDSLPTLARDDFDVLPGSVSALHRFLHQSLSLRILIQLSELRQFGILRLPLRENWHLCLLSL